MKRNTILFVLIGLFTQWSMAQAPKWLDKSRRAVFSVVTYDKSDKILNSGNGFFVTEDGLALSDYNLFKGAERAVVIDSEGKQMPVKSIQGANGMYDVVKFRVELSGKKVTALPVAANASAVDATVYLLPYSTQKVASFTTGKVKDVSTVGELYQYYGISMKLDDRMVSCPVVNTEGQAIGIVQKSSGKDADEVCYAISASYGNSLAITALSTNDYTLNSIGIRKGLPDNEEQALVYIYMASSLMAPEAYAALLDEYIAQYPNSADGYLRRANHYIYLSNEESSVEKAAADVERALAVAQKKDDTYYNIAKLVYAYRLSNPENIYKDWTYERALADVRAAMAVEPMPVYIQLEGDVLFAMQDYPGAFTSYEKVTRTNLASPAAFFSAAKAKELMQEDKKEVVALLDSCIAYCVTPMTSDNAPYLLERARLYMETEQYRSAMLDYDAYFKAMNGSVNDLFYYYREQASFHARQFQRALDDIHKAIEMSPDDITYHVELGVINIRIGRNEEALKAISRAIELDPKYGEAYRLQGIAQLQLKKKNEACASFAKAKELGDPNVDALIEKHCK